MKHLILFFLLFIALSSNAQIPNPFHRSVESLANKFKKQYPDDSTRTVAIYDWIKSYMRYDLRAFEKYKFKVNSYSLSKILYRRKALCFGLSKLFQDLCLRSGIKCVQLQGYAFEDPNDPYIHYYYDNHAWNTASINGHWYLFDVTYDNGFIKKKKRVIRKFLNKTFSIPLLYEKTKYIHQPANRFSFKSGAQFIHSHYPVLINGVLINDKVSIASFAKNEVSVSGDYNPSSYPNMAQLYDFAGSNESIQLKIAADQSALFNPKNNLIKTVNYHNSLFHFNKIKSNFNKSDVDTVIKYAALFKRDNTALHSKNSKRVSDEHKSLLASLNKALSHNERLAIQYNKKGIRGITKLAKTAEANAIKSNKIEERQLKLEEHLAGSRKKNDTIPFPTHLVQHKKTVATGDSLLFTLNKANGVLDSLSMRSEELFNSTYHLLKERVMLLNAHRAGDMNLKTYPKLSVVASDIDSVTSLIDRYKTQIDKTEYEYNKVRQQAIRNATSGFTLTSKEYIKTQTGISVPLPYSKDTLVAELFVRTNAFKEALVVFYHHDEEIANTQTSHYLSAAKFLKGEKKLIQKTIVMRQMAYSCRINHENRRYKAYDNYVFSIANSMRMLKMSYKRK